MKIISTRLRGVLYAAVFLSFVISVFDSCKKHDSPPPAGQTALGSLQGVDGFCLPGTAHGTFYAGASSSRDTNYVDISVYVTRAGSYKILSDTVHGVVFSGSGTFTSTGVQTARLKGSGNFSLVGSANFTIGFDGTVCGFSIDVKPLPLADNTWYGTFGGHKYQGTAYAVVTFFGGDNAFDLVGTSTGSPDTTLSFRVRMPQRPDFFGVTLGTYFSSNPGAHFTLAAKGVPVLTAQGAGPAVITFQFTNAFWYPNGSDMYDGIFNGKCKDVNGNLVEVKNGAFRAGE